MKLVHGTVIQSGELPSAKQTFLKQLAAIAEYVGDGRCARLRALLEELPEVRNAVHGDFQMKNVMLLDGEPTLIDMDTLSAGLPLFDLQGLYVAYVAFREDEADNTEKFLGISGEVADYIWRTALEYYFNGKDRAALKDIEDKIRVVAYIRFLYILTTSSHKENGLFPVRLEHTIRNLDELLARVRTLCI